MHVQPLGIRSKRFKNEARKSIFLGYAPISSRVITWFNYSSERVKFATHGKFDESFNDLRADNLPPNCQQILRINGSPVPIDKKETSTSDLKFFIYPFADKETIQVPILPSNKNSSFGLDLQDDDFSGRTYIKEIADTKSSSAAKIFNNIKRSRATLRGAFVIHINGFPVFSTAQATAQLALLFDQWQQARKQGVENFSFELTFAREQQLKGRKLKQAIDDYHNLTPGTTKRTKSKAEDDEDVELNTDLYDASERLKTGFKIYRAFDGIIYTGEIAAYDPRDRMYHIKYEDGDDEWLFHNEVHS